jgi:hypothetical protein
MARTTTLRRRRRSSRPATVVSPRIFPSARLIVITVRAPFLESAVEDLFVDSQVRLEHAVSGLRALAGPEVDDPQLSELVGELSIRSDKFRRLWSRRAAHGHRACGFLGL